MEVAIRKRRNEPISQLVSKTADTSFSSTRPDPVLERIHANSPIRSTIRTTATQKSYNPAVSSHFVTVPSRVAGWGGSRVPSLFLSQGFYF